MLKGVNSIQRSVIIVLCTYVTLCANLSVSLVVHERFAQWDQLDLARSLEWEKVVLWGFNSELFQGGWMVESVKVKGRNVGRRFVTANR